MKEFAISLPPRHRDHSIWLHQRGLSLIELMVGLAIGLLTVAVAMGALMASRSVTSTVTDASQLQQQSAYAFRVFAQQLRQAGSMRLNLAANKTEDEDIDIADPVAFETKVNGFDPTQHILRGKDNPGTNEYQIEVGYRNYKEKLHISSTKASLLRNCLGEENNDNLIQSRFVLRNNVLHCAGSGTAQPIVHNVANFKTRYLLQTAPNGDPKLQYANATTVNNQWSRVVAIEICIVLFGNESIDMPTDSTYSDCPDADGSVAQINMSTLAAPRTRKVHKTFSTVFQIRSQGLIYSSN